MIKRKWISFLFLSSISLSAFSLPLTQTANSLEKATEGLNNFAFSLYQQVGQNKQNLVLSPYSLSSLLSILLNGAAGNTEAQLSQVLHLDRETNRFILEKIDNELIHNNACHGWFHCKMQAVQRSLGMGQPKPLFLLANSLWADQSFSYKESFLAPIAESKSIHFFLTNFTKSPKTARQAINAWVAKKTHSYIKDLIPQGALNTKTKLVLVNAIYFNGLWQLPFKSENTQNKPFFLATGQSLQSPMMMQQAHFLYSENKSLQMLQLSYSKSTLKMAILLPKPSHSLPEIRKNLNSGRFQQLLRAAQDREVALQLPKFKLSSTFDTLDGSLKKLGLTDAFSEKANFANMTDSKILIAKAIQKAIIEIDEKGTVAKAASALITVTSANMQVPVQFNANHPFLFIIYDSQTGLILFMGQVTNPLEH